MAEQLTMFPETKQEKYEEERSVFGGIYKDKGVPIDEMTEWGIAWGRGSVCFIFDGILHIEEIVEHGGLHNMELVQGYALGLKLHDKIWQIRNSGRKGQPDYIIGHGTYTDGFYESLEKYRKILMK
jgi:hypothetical protein